MFVETKAFSLTPCILRSFFSQRQLKLAFVFLQSQVAIDEIVEILYQLLHWPVLSRTGIMVKLTWHNFSCLHTGLISVANTSAFGEEEVLVEDGSTYRPGFSSSGASKTPFTGCSSLPYQRG